MYYLTINTEQYSARDSEKILNLQKEFTDNINSLIRPPKSPKDIKFVVVKNTEMRYVMNAAMNYLNDREWRYTGGCWLSKIITLDSGLDVLVGALWWIDND